MALQMNETEGTSMKRRILALVLAALLALSGMAALSEATAWTCPNCASENTGNFCPNCGTARPAAGWTCPNCGEANEDSYNFCANCGAAKPPVGWTCPGCGEGNDASYKFCANCGAAKPDVGANGSAQAEDDYDAWLDLAFEDGEVRFAAVEPALPDFDTCELVIPDIIWNTLAASGVDETRLRALIKQGTITPVSFSPDGACLAAILDVDIGSTPVVISGERMALIYPTESRGVEDIYGNLQKTYDSWIANPRRPMGAGDEGFIWSPGGHYFCVPNVNTMLVNMQFARVNPIVVDTWTGEMFLVDTYSDKIFDDSNGAMITGCFSEDERYFYELFYGTGYSTRTMLLRYDLETFEVQPLAGLETNGYPALSMLRDGRMLTISDTMQRDKFQGLAVMSPEGGLEITPMPVPLRAWYANRTYYSAKSGWLLVRGRTQGSASTMLTAIQRVQPDSDPARELNAAWALNWDEGVMDPLDLTKLDPESSALDEDDLIEALAPYAILLDVKLSPDGRYAAMLAVKDNEAQVYIARLKDMALLPAGDIEVDTSVLVGAASGGAPLLSWSEAGLLVFANGVPALWQLD